MRCKEQQDGPVTHLSALGYNSDRDWPYDDVDDEDLECRATFRVFELSPSACRVQAAWEAGKEHEEWPLYEALIEELRQTLGATDVSGPTCAEGQESSDRTRGGGARRLEQREDWAHKREIAERWVQAWKSGRTTQEAAAHREGYHVDTLRNWARRAGYMD